MSLLSLSVLRGSLNISPSFDRDLIKKISTNKAIVISTHILEEVEAVCSRTVIIANGQLLANETPDNLGKQFNKKKKHLLQKYFRFNINA